MSTSTVPPPGAEPDAFFHPDGDRFLSTAWTRGPWSAQHQHGGPAAALCARAIEARIAAEARAPMRVVRMTVEFVRPLPIAPVTIAAEVRRPGRKAMWLAATVSAGGEVVCRAAALAIRTTPLPVDAGAPAEVAPRTVEASPAWSFPFFSDAAGYQRAMEVRLARGQFGDGSMAAWFRLRCPVVLGDAGPSPLQRVMAAADSGNGVAVALDVNRWTFLNPDLTVHLLRPPATEWVCLDATTRFAGDGVGLAETRLYDERGAIGRGLQSLVLEARPPAKSDPGSLPST